MKFRTETVLRYAMWGSEVARSEIFTEEALVLVKAWPHVGQRHGETVCCAGVTRNREWRRHFPVSFRTLADRDKFKRWQWIKYDCILPKNDRRPESRSIIEGSIQVGGTIKRSERADFLRPLVRNSTKIAAENGETLALIEPRNLKFSWVEKSDAEIAKEEARSKEWASQYSFLTDPVTPLQSCPYSFKFSYIDGEGNSRNSTCDDWETGATFRRRQRDMGTEGALNSMKEQFEGDYLKQGCVFAMGTHSMFPETWLLVGVIRLDDTQQASLF